MKKKNELVNGKGKKEPKKKLNRKEEKENN